MVRTITIPGFAYLANYIINGDEDGLGWPEMDQARRWLASHDVTQDDCLGLVEDSNGEPISYFGEINGYHDQIYKYVFATEDELRCMMCAQSVDHLDYDSGLCAECTEKLTEPR